MRFKISTQGFTDIINITLKVSEIVDKSGVKEGICSVSLNGSTCGLTTMEYEDGLIKDIKRALDKIAPQSKDYEHCKKWGDCNGFSHVRSSLMRPFITIPIENSKLVLGTWQQLVALDFDNRPRKREVIVKIVGK